MPGGSRVRKRRLLRGSLGATAQTGTGNINADPLFVSSGTFDYHLQASSPAIDVADPGATLATDLDGDVRPQGNRSDMGADEVVP